MSIQAVDAEVRAAHEQETLLRELLAEVKALRAELPAVCICHGDPVTFATCPVHRYKTEPT